MAVTLYRKDDLVGFQVSRERADELIQGAGYTESYEEALALSTTLGGSNYTAPLGETNKTSNSTTLTAEARSRIVEQTKLKFGNLLTPSLLEEYVDKYIEFGNDESSAIASIRSMDEYKVAFPGNLNPDGATVKYAEAEYAQIQDAYRRKFEAININPDIVLSTERQAQLIENVVSPNELGERIELVRDNIVNAIPQVKEFYQRNFERTLSDEEIILSAIDPGIGEKIISGTISSQDVVIDSIKTAQIGAEALLAGTDITVDVANQLRELGLSVDKARRGFQQVRSLQQQALQQGRDIPSVQDIIEGTELGQSEELREVINIIRQQESGSSVQFGAAQSRTGQVTGLIES